MKKIRKQKRIFTNEEEKTIDETIKHHLLFYVVTISRSYDNYHNDMLVCVRQK